jgi:hypothetical protein
MTTPEKLLQMKEWLTVSEAAEYLRQVFDKHLTAADVLRYALNGHLKLSLRFLSGVAVAAGESQEGRGSLWSWDDHPTGVMQVLPGWVVDLPLVGLERLHVERQFQAATGASDPDSVSDPHGLWFVQLLPSGRVVILLEGEVPEEWPAKFSRFSDLAARSIPEGAVLVVRPAALEQFARTLADRPSRDLPAPKDAAPSLGSGQGEKPGGSAQMVGGPRLAKWLEDRMDEQEMTVSRLHERSGPARKTIQKMLDGRRVRRSHLKKLASGLSHERLEVSVSDFPTD